ncbi:MAG: molecular chaperone HtpG [Verrucomicrobia bacterium]|nr:molecular chaperone HtpG [Verrucomicrobiota bacterium]MBI3868523.1 molecular chaperone HtpG [Verrucomicrobiota bacterium]
MSIPEKHSFQAEIQQLLDIVIHSLYTDREIFVRELISNAADACEKLRFLQASGQAIVDPDAPLLIQVKTDEKEGTVRFIDSGIGMSREDLVENLGTIAHSGTKAFLKGLAEEKRADAKLIGQFGVGFYAAFMVAEQVTVESRPHQPDGVACRWVSQGTTGYELEASSRPQRGTEIALKLKSDAATYAQESTLEAIIRRYSAFVPIPIELNGKRLNTVQALWTRNRSEIKEDEYNEFYQFLGHDHQPALLRLHFTADAPLAIQSLLFVPQTNFESMGLGRMESEVNLYCRKVLIQSKAKHLFPDWLRFLRGVVDSEDLPLNISRETMQDSSLMQRLNKALTGRFLKMLEETAEKDPETYRKFYGEYSRFLKEGVVTDAAHKQGLGKLLRYESSALDAGVHTSLADYVKRMPADQKEIYCLLATSRESGLSSPFYEVFAARKFEVLLLQDPWDEFVVEHLDRFDDKPLRLAEKADLDLSDKPSSGLSDEQAGALARWMKETLGEKVNEVRLSKRLLDSPVLAVDSNKYMTASMRRMLRSAKRDAGGLEASKSDFEFNPAHVLLAQLDALRQKDAALAGKVAEQLFDNARIAAGLLEDPREMLKRSNQLLTELLAAKQA